jgi:prefoldin subunit 5
LVLASIQPALPNEIIFSQNQYLYASKIDTFRQEIHSLENKTQQLEEALDSLNKLQQRYGFLLLGLTFSVQASPHQKQVNPSHLQININ